MPLSYAELEEFYEDLVTRARRRGIACAITSGMACVAFGVAEATKDCDLLCAPEGAGAFLGLLEEASLRGHLPSYRGHLTPPLDARWLRGGWTSHFVWDTSEEVACPRRNCFGDPARNPGPMRGEPPAEEPPACLRHRANDRGGAEGARADGAAFHPGVVARRARTV